MQRYRLVVVVAAAAVRMVRNRMGLKLDQAEADTCTSRITSLSAGSFIQQRKADPRRLRRYRQCVGRLIIKTPILLQ